jgi:hypothetical protein
LWQEQPQHGWLHSNWQIQTEEKGSLWSQSWTWKEVFGLPLSFLKRLMHLKGNWSLKRLQAGRRETKKAESILFTEINLTTSSDEGENKEYLFTSSEPFSSSKTKLAKSSHPTTELVVSLIVNNEEHLVRALANTGTSSSIILEAYTSAHSSKQMTVIQPPGVQWVVSLLQIKLGYICDIFTPRVQPQETNLLGISCRWPFWVIKHIW